MIIPGCDNLPETSDELIFNNVCRLLNVDPVVVINNNSKRKREYVIARQVTMTIFIMKKNYSQARAAAFFNKEHATAIHAMKTVKNLLDTDKDFRNTVAHLMPQHLLDDSINKPNNNGKRKTSYSGKPAVYARLPKQVVRSGDNITTRR